MKKIAAALIAVLLICSFTACGAKQEENSQESDAQNTDVTTVVAGADDSYVFDIKEDDHTFVFSMANTYHVYTHDGKKITGYCLYSDVGSAEQAQAAASQVDVNDDYFKSMGYKSVATKGKYMIVEFTEEGFEYKSFEELKEAYEEYKSLG